MEKYVSEYIDDIIYIYGFNFVFIVVCEKSGDCIEFVVLIMVLMWVLGKSGCVVFGMVIIEDEVGVIVYGYVWIEVWYDNKW